MECIVLYIPNLKSRHIYPPNINLAILESLIKNYPQTKRNDPPSCRPLTGWPLGRAGVLSRTGQKSCIPISDPVGQRPGRGEVRPCPINADPLRALGTSRGRCEKCMLAEILMLHSQHTQGKTHNVSDEQDLTGDTVWILYFFPLKIYEQGGCLLFQAMFLSCLCLVFFIACVVHPFKHCQIYDR